MSAFHDVRFPLSIGLAARGGPERRTEIVALASGREERNSPWIGSRRRWDAAPGVRSLDDVARLTAFFEARRGALHAFRFLDPLDHKSCLPSVEPSAGDQVIGTGDGVEARFALIKTYGEGETAWARPVQAPVAESLVLAIDGVPTSFTLEPEGRVLLDIPPAPGAVVTAGFRFDTPVRFDTDRLEVGADGSAAGQIASVPLIEVLL
jgi:uncharacterized protein (TIGR02217 family)